MLPIKKPGKFRIIDWAGNICFFDKRFDYEEDAHDHVSENVEKDEIQEYAVVEVE
jgi:hypothetical protein